jgi:predicted O-methyltransferase YrrM
MEGNTMTRKTAILVTVIVLSIAVGAVLLLSPKPGGRLDSGETPQQAEGVNPKEITIRNVTHDVVRYKIGPVGAVSKAPERSLDVGVVDRIPATDTMVVSYMKHNTEVNYSLYPGKAYSFRYDSYGQIDIWVGAHGREDAADLAPFVPTPEVVVSRMLEMAKVTKDSVVYDIGCGDGRIVIAAAQKYSARGVGIDIDPARIRECKANARAANVEDRVKFRQEDATKVDISEATVVTLYLLPESNEMLRPKLESELKPGVLVVSHNYVVPGWEDKEIATEVVTGADGKEHSIFLYKR